MLQPSSFQDFIILKINVKFTEKLSSVLLLNLEILQHQVFTPFVRETKLAAPFCITTYKVKNSDKTFQTYELKPEQGTLFLSTFPTKQKKLTMRISTQDGDGEKVRVSLPVHRDGKALIRSPSLNQDKSHNSRMS